MQVYLLSFLFILSTSLGKTPNFYPNFIAAKEASKNYNKDLLVFFTKNSDATCEAAWAEFEKDPIASKLYISTSISIQDFDGAVFLDKYGLDNAPAWLVLDPQGQVKDKWQGEWKKTPARPKGPKPSSVQTEKVIEEKASVSMTAAETKVVQEEIVQEAKTSAPVKPETPIEEVVVVATPETNVTETEEVIVVKEVVVEEVVKEEVVEEEVVEEEVVEEKAAEETVIENASIKTTQVPVSTAAVPVVVEQQLQGFVIQTGYFGSEANALGLVSRLNEKGFQDFTILPSERDGSTFHRVVSGTYSTEAEAKQNAKALEEAGIKGTVKNRKDI